MQKKKDKKDKAPRKKREKLPTGAAFEALQFAVVDGEFAPLDSNSILILRRPRYGGEDVYSRCTVLSHDKETGDVMLWDLTNQSKFPFNVKRDISLFPHLRINK